jgi:hypothetical protein
MTQRTFPGQPDSLQDATVIEIDPLTVDKITAYLSYRFPDGSQRPSVQRRWQPLIDHIRVHSRGALAASLSSPFHLFLAVAAYQSPDTTPIELTTMAARDLERHLFDGFISAAYRPGAPYLRGKWSTHAAERWLTFLARHLKYTVHSSDIAWWRLREEVPPAVPGLGAGAGAGLAIGLASGIGAGYVVGLAAGMASMLTGWLAVRFAAVRWPLPAPPRRVGRYFSLGRITSVLTVGLAGQLAIGLAFGLRSGLSHGLRAGIDAGLGPGFAGLASGLALGLAAARWGLPEPSHRLRWRPSMSSLAAGIGAGAAVGMATGLPYGLRFGITSGSVICIWLAAAVGLEGVPPDPSRAATPQVVMGHDRKAAITVTLLIGFGVGLGVGFGFPLAYGLIIGTAYGTAYGLVVSMLRTAWPSYLLTLGWLSLRYRLPWSLMDFLADAHRRGVLRQVGTVYQFRHITLRDHLAQR